jgi:hypothetical protein
MKKCSYCGKEAPDDATVCPLDGKPVVDPTAPPKPTNGPLHNMRLARDIRDERPKRVQKAMTVLYITLGIGIIRAVIEGSANVKMAGVGFFIFVTLAVFAVMVFLIAMIGRRKNWARITILILFIIGLLPSIQPLIRSFTLSPFSGLLGLAQVVLQIVALAFLFRRESSEWFKPTAT